MVVKTCPGKHSFLKSQARMLATGNGGSEVLLAPAIGFHFQCLNEVLCNKAV